MNPLKNNFLYDIYFKLRFITQTSKELNSEVEFYKALLKDYNIIFDVGANHGNKTSPFLKIAKKVIAFEPDKSNVEFLKLRFRNTKNIIIEPLAISDKIGAAIFFVVNNGSGLNTINKSRAHQLNIKTDYPVQTTTIDEMIKIYGLPSFIKIDVEGHELEVLQGLSHAISLIVFEANLPTAIRQTLLSLDKIHSLCANYHFNYGFDVGLISEKWLTMEEIKSFINNTDIQYLNLYCKLFDKNSQA